MTRQKSIATFIVVLIGLQSGAQSIINTSSIAHDLDSAISVVADLGGDFSRGNSSVNHLKLNAGLGKSLSESSSLWLIGGYNELKGNGVLLQRSAFTHVRLNYELTPRTTVNTYVQWQNNIVLSMKSRQLTGFNIDFDLDQKKSSTLMLGAFYENELYEDDNRARLVRANIVAVSEQKVGQISLVGFLYYQPSIIRPSDFRCIGELSARVKLFKSTQLAINSAARFDSSPHSGLSSSDMTITTSVRYQFHKP